MSGMHKDVVLAVSAARKLFLKYKSINNGKIQKPVPITQKIGSGWSQDVANYGLLRSAESLVGLAVKAVAFSRPAGSEGTIAAMIARDATNAKIFVSDGHNFCWSRFLVAKELCHLIQGAFDDKTMSSEPQEIIDLLSDLLSPESGALRQAKLFTLENAAYFGAIELLLPMEFQEEIMKLISNGCDLLRIAHMYKVPELIVEFRCRNPHTINLFNAVYEEHSYIHADMFP